MVKRRNELQGQYDRAHSHARELAGAIAAYDEIIETFGSLPNTGEIIVTGSGSVGATQLSLPRPYLPGSTRVWLNGTQLYLGIDYTESDPAGGFLTLVTPVASLDDVYRTAFIANGPYPGEA